MKITYKKINPAKAKADIYIAGVYSKFKYKSKLISKGVIKLARSMGFEAKIGQVQTVSSGKKTIMLVGLGDKGKLTLDGVRLAAARVTQELRKIKKSTAVCEIIGKDKFPEKAIKALTEGFILGDYKFKKYKKDDEYNTNIFICSEENYRKAFEEAKIIARATNFTRDLVNEPANIITPSTFTSRVEELCAELNLECKVLNEDHLAKKRMVGILSVGKGSKNPPRFVHAIYKPEDAAGKISLIGKGITFDSGGLNTKPEQFMRKMKADKAGACAVLGIIKAAAELKVNTEIHGLIPLAENMPDGGAFRPDDIIVFSNGKSVEIHNTDAEGRLILADALIYSSQLKPDIAIDMATLTGACVVALGPYTSGIFTENRKLLKTMLAASEYTGEKLWHMPLDSDLEDDIKGEFTDLQNLGKTRYGGAITAALFLRHFTGSNTKNWIHIDIAGPAFLDKPWKYYSSGATGQPVRTILEFITSITG